MSLFPCSQDQCECLYCTILPKKIWITQRDWLVSSQWDLLFLSGIRFDGSFSFVFTHFQSSLCIYKVAFLWLSPPFPSALEPHCLLLTPAAFWSCLKSLSHVQFCDPVDCRLLCPWDSPGKNTGMDAIPFSRGSSQLRDQTQVSCIAGGFFTIWATRGPWGHYAKWSKSEEDKYYMITLICEILKRKSKTRS